MAKLPELRKKAMKSLTEIRIKANELFPDTAITLAHLLTVWFKIEENPSSCHYFDKCGIDSKKVETILKKFYVIHSIEEEQDDRGVLTNATIKAKNQETKGIHILKILLLNKTHRITKQLRIAGLRSKIVLENIENLIHKATVLDGAGIILDIKYKNLLSFSRDLKTLAEDNQFTELAIREQELKVLNDILLKKRKGNAILTGPAGVGKTAIVELLANEIATNPLSPFYGYQIFEVSLAKMIANTKYRGEFEKKFELLMNEVLENPKCIIFMDEIHLLFGTGSAEGATMDAANLLKPYIARDKVKLIGATTSYEYQRFFTKDEALARRFQELKLREPEHSLLLKIVKQQVKSLEKHHDLEISEELIIKAIEMSSQYITNRHQPDKTIDLLDTAAVITRRNHKRKLEIENLYEAVSNMTALPIRSILGTNKTLLKELTKKLKQRIIGQDKAIDLVVSSIISRQFDLSEEDRPLGVFLFVGDTGVGKTEMAKQLAKYYFQDQRKMIRFDLAEYSSPASVSKLVGSSPGLIGSDREGKLILALQENPACLLLFDEAEKAHPDVMKLLLGLLENGRISDNYGKEYDAKQCIIILTSNAVTNKDLNPKSIGFISNTSFKPNPQDLLSKVFSIEFLGRLDAIIPFSTLKENDYRKIIALKLEDLEKRLAKKMIKIMYTKKSIINYIFGILENNKTGVRGLNTILEQLVIHPITRELMKDNAEDDYSIDLDSLIILNEYRSFPY